MFHICHKAITPPFILCSVRLRPWCCIFPPVHCRPHTSLCGLQSVLLWQRSYRQESETCPCMQDSTKHTKMLVTIFFIFFIQKLRNLGVNWKIRAIRQECIFFLRDIIKPLLCFFCVAGTTSKCKCKDWRLW